MASEYQQTMEKDIQDRVRSKYRVPIDQLRALNFQELCFFSESMAALGLSTGLIGLIGVLAALPNEVSRIGKDLRASVFFVLMASPERDVYASPFGLGTKFYTSFTDGTCLITANFSSQAIQDDGEKLYKFAKPCSIEAAWKHHRTWVNERIAAGKQPVYHLSFEDYIKLARKEDSYMLKPKPLTNALFGDVGSAALGGIIFGCLLAAVVLLFLALPNLVHTLYPACWYVRDLGKPPLPQSLLIVFAGIALSWFLARIQKCMYLINGIGTMWRGQTPLPNSQGYISTKWLVFMHLPLLPVQSYQVVEKISNSSGQKVSSTEPLAQLHWAQIRETIWQFKWWYLLVAFLWIGFGVWALSQCM